MDQLKELEETFIEEYESAKLLEGLKKDKSTTILLSKALFALLDYIILAKYNNLPKNHTERFRILENKEPKTYSLVDSVWSKYTNTYSKPSSKESINLLKNVIMEVVKKNERISEEIKKSIGRK